MELPDGSIEKAEYERTLIVPQQPKRKPFLLCTIGLVGAGKTTVVKPLSEQLSLVRVSGDEIRKILKEHNRKDGYQLVGDIAWAVIDNYLSLGYSVAIDSDCAREFSRHMIVKMQEKYHALPIWIHINPPEEFILHNLQTREPTWLFKDAEAAIENYLAKKQQHEQLQEDLHKIPFIYTFDTSRSDLPHQINEAVDLIEEEVKDEEK